MTNWKLWCSETNKYVDMVVLNLIPTQRERISTTLLLTFLSYVKKNLGTDFPQSTLNVPNLHRNLRIGCLDSKISLPASTATTYSYSNQYADHKKILFFYLNFLFCIYIYENNNNSCLYPLTKFLIKYYSI